ncbi:MAG TPA: N-acetylneuraminate synthase family protein [Azospirillum sp.]
MRIGQFDTAQDVLIIAEIGNNHEGNPQVAEELVHRAAEAGVQAVKFQTFRTELFVAPSQAERFARMKRFELSQETFAHLARVARDKGLLFISTPLDCESAAFLDGIVDAVKVASGDNTFYPLIEQVAATDKPLIISGGLADLDELAYTKALVDKVRHESGRHGHGRAADLALLHCVSAYPVAPEQANLAAVRTLAARFPDCTIGYSDHTLGVTAPVLAVAAGARIIEKHFTLDRNFSEFRDHQLSADPAMLRQLVEEVREAQTLLGSGAKVAQPDEAAALTAIRRSIAARRDLTAGAVVGPDAIVWIRPGDGIPPGQEARVLGRRLKANVAAGTLLTDDVLE